MRDVLTVLAGLVIVILAAALAAPPFVDWRLHRDWVEAGIARGTGLAIRTEGDLALRFLPTPRIEIGSLAAGSAEGVALDASEVSVELALTPLLHGEWRVLGASAARTEVTLPDGLAGPDGTAWTFPRALLPTGAGLAVAIDDLSIAELTIAVRDRPDRRPVAVQGFRAQAQALAGPWRVEGKVESRVGATPFELSTGEAVDRTAAVKLGIGPPAARITLDGQAKLADGPGDTLLPGLTGIVRFALAAAREGASGPPIPILVQGQVKASGREAAFEGISVEAGAGAGALRLGGTGRLGLAEGRLDLALDGRRLDLDALGSAFTGRGAAWRPALPIPLAATLKLDSVGLGGEELTGLTARLAMTGSRLAVGDLGVTAPGRVGIRLSGEVELDVETSADGHLRVDAPAGDALSGLLTRWGSGHPALAALDGRPVAFESDASAGAFGASLRNARLTVGDAAVSGLLRYTAPDAVTRGRVDAQLAVQNLDLAGLPPGGIDLPRDLDLGLAIDARGLRYGGARGVGRVAGRISSDAGSLLLERLEIVDLAGANGMLSGRVSPEGRARIEGRLTARRAAPLIDLVARPWLGDLAGYVPSVLRAGSLDLAVAAEREGAGQPLRTRLTGTMAEGPFEAETVTLAGRPSRVAVTASTTRTGAWLGRPAAALPPSRLVLQGARDGSDRLAFAISGEVAGLRVATSRPVTLDARDRDLVGGEFDLASDDLSPALALAGEGVAPGRAVPAALHLKLARDAGATRLAVEGRIAGGTVAADLAGASPDALSGSLRTERLSLPWLASALALNRFEPGGAGWSTTRFGARPDPVLGGAIRVEAASLDLGGLVAANARFDLSTIPDGFTVAGLEMEVAGGRAAGGFSLMRQGGLASLTGQGKVGGIDIAPLVGPPVAAGRLEAELRFGGSGETLAGIVASLSGAGTASVERVELAGADPAGIDRAAGRALRSDDPLAQARLATLAGDEIARGPFRPEGRLSAPAILVAGALRLSPLVGASDAGSWAGSAGLDLRAFALDLRGSLQAKTQPRTWSGPPPALSLGWAGPLGRVQRSVGVAPLVNGLAQAVLTRELDRIDTFELDAAERARLTSRVEMDRARRIAAEEVARQARLEAERAERARIEAERARAAEEAARPLDIRPPAQQAAPSGG